MNEWMNEVNLTHPIKRFDLTFQLRFSFSATPQIYLEKKIFSYHFYILCDVNMFYKNYHEL